MLQFPTKEEFIQARFERLKSNYNVDFTGLPNNILNYYRNVFDGWWSKDLHSPTPLKKWIENLVQFIDIQAEKYRLSAFSKLVEYIKGKYQFHLDFECNRPNGKCDVNGLYERITDLLDEAFMKWKQVNSIVPIKKYDNYYIDSRLEQVPVDFENVPPGAIAHLLHSFELADDFRTNEDYTRWVHDLQSTLKIIPKEFRLQGLKKGIEYGNGAYNLHLKDCDNLVSCPYNESWKARFVLANEVMESMQDSAEPTTQPEIKSNPEFTLSRQVLAIHYLLEYAKIPNVDRAVKARFVQFLTGRETGAKEIKNTNIYKKVDKPLGATDKTLLADLQFVQQHFQNLGLSEISKMIDNEISTIKT